MEILIPMALIKDLGNLDLILTDCGCGRLTIHGFPRQLRWHESKVDNRVTPLVHCENCGLAFFRSWELSTKEITESVVQ